MTLITWKDALGLNFLERTILEKMRPEIKKTIDRWYLCEKTLEINHYPLDLGRFFFQCHSIEEELNDILNRLGKLCKIERTEYHDINEKIDFLIELHQSGLPQDIGLMNFSLDEISEIKNIIYRVLKTRLDLGSGEIKMSNDVRAWPNSKIFYNAKNELGDAHRWLHELAREIGKKYVQKYG